MRPMIVCERITSWIMPARMLSGLDQGSDHGSNHLGMAQLGSSHPSSVSLNWNILNMLIHGIFGFFAKQ